MEYVLIVAVLFVLILLFKSVVVIRQAETMIVERLGRYHKTLESGINVILPIIDKPRLIDWRYVKTDPSGKYAYMHSKTPRIDLRESVYDFPRQNVITKDNVSIEINALLYFQVMDPMKSVYEISNLPDAIQKLTQTTLRNVIGELDLDETLTSRDTINSKLRIILDEASNKWGVKVNRVELQDIIPPRDIQDAMEKQMRAERDRRATLLTADASKQAAVLESLGQRESQINNAEGEKRSQILIAEGEAEARKRVAEGEAEAIRLVTATVKESGGDPTQYLIAIRYIEALKELGLNGNKTVFMPYEASGVMGSLGSLKEMFKSSDS
ncbi:MAG: SPFH/Band 7/PHB domain protein [Ignavibacteria bacterium]|nr:SPFH/Band 7/PHB domain protein [Ignavibacteria bacterium]MBP6510774.1 SPFH/Band 7/PHB domain protein [Candidatus Kapabacteria bacterium]MBK6420561.1 SPFH/Band 7/PHB domain protein [Ignavibacteria bacterium]MBK7033506.1 SPFH/Band 7/PHB domain protein [Ignavibacteria bacterium]MBK7186275.1 SPFH/Band 7/PHB domain protein [Ignavibacteria bacterium]